MLVSTTSHTFFLHLPLRSGMGRNTKLVAASLSVLAQVPLLALFVLPPTVTESGFPNRELFMVLSSAVDPRNHVAAVTPAMIRPPRADQVTPPQIEVTNPQGPQSLPPRPDPAHPNAGPSMGTDGVSISSSRSLVVLLRVLVLENGLIGEARVVGSCGNHNVDEGAMRFVKANWRFLPALDHGVPIATWATIEVGPND
jgi:TonB family protein